MPRIAANRFYWFICGIFMICMLPCITTYAFERGIYVTQYSLEHTKVIKRLIQQAKQVGINTFVIDFNRNSKRTTNNIKLVEKAHLRFVARIVMFPHGALPYQVKSKKYLQKRYRQIRQAIALGANAIQLDYIRYRPSQKPSPQNAHNIHKVIAQVKQILVGTHVALQIDIFGVAAHRESRSIGHNAPLFANSVDAINPMVYPSHYEPFRYHARRPYQTVYDSLIALKRQLRQHPHVKVHAYIELYNYRYPLSREAKIHYIKSQIRATHNAKSQGWYAWSARNKYSLLFQIMANKKDMIKAKLAKRRVTKIYQKKAKAVIKNILTAVIVEERLAEESKETVFNQLTKSATHHELSKPSFDLNEANALRDGVVQDISNFLLGPTAMGQGIEQ